MPRISQNRQEWPINQRFLKDAGAEEGKARKAAETVAAYENRFTKIETGLAPLEKMAGFNLAGTVAPVLLVLRH